MIERIESFFTGSVHQFTSALANLAGRSSPADCHPADDFVHELTYRINESLTACAELEAEIRSDGVLLKSVQRRYREAIWPWLGQSWFMRRALEKPRGYPGDYELLTAIYNGEVKSLGLGAALDRYFLKTTLAQAVVARMQAVRDFLEEELNSRQGNVTVLNVASGACREYTLNFVPTNSRRIDVTCIDNDLLALEFVRTNVAPQLPQHIQLSFTRYNALRMVRAEQNVKRFGRPDVLYSVGLCDYIPDEYLIPMLRAWRESVNDGGVVYVAFKDARRYETPEYQWLVDWFFFQRTEEDCRRLFAEAGYGDSALTTTRDTTGVILNYVARMTAAVDAHRRMDSAERLPTAPQLAPSTVRETAK
ncbi:MAG TPA: hypothetical protein VFV87_15780 [Pirellulaceae bacterium]|nr:hypothetical protein [Pirellulaceae bacterium]